MLHENGYNMVFDALTDFPAQCFLSRIDLLGCLLDFMASPLLGALSGVEGDFPGHPGGVDTKGILTPVAVMEWFEKLLDKACSEYKVQIDGFLCSGVFLDMDATSNMEGDIAGDFTTSAAFKMVCR